MNIIILDGITKLHYDAFVNYFLETEFHHLSGSQKTMCIVDSGIAFNSPYPTLIREEREVDLLLSFDFSQRDGGDTALPFKVRFLIVIATV